MDALHRMGITRWQFRAPAGNALLENLACDSDSALILDEDDVNVFDARSVPEQDRLSMAEERELSPNEKALTKTSSAVAHTDPIHKKLAPSNGQLTESANDLSFANKFKAMEIESDARASVARARNDSSELAVRNSIETALSMRGRLLNGKNTSDVFVVACSEGRNRDVLIDMHQESGKLLSAMLKSALPASNVSMPSVLMLGADNNDNAHIGKLMLLLGERAAKTVLGPDVKPPYRGKVHLVSGVRAVCTYHPEELRQNATLKPMAWDDLRLFASLWPNQADDALNINP